MTREYKVIFSPIFSQGRRATIYGLFSQFVSFSSNQFILVLSFFSFLLLLSVYVNRGFIIFIKNNWREFHCGHFRPLPPWSLDHPLIVLVSKLLNGDTYDTWSHSMSIAHSAKNKTGLFDGSGRNHHEMMKNLLWKSYNNMVLSLILNSIEIEPANSVIYVESTIEVWKDLKEWFS